MTDKEKILEYLKFKGISKNKFYNKTGFSVGFLDKGNSLVVDKLRILLEKYPDFNEKWLIRDEGEMIRVDSFDGNQIPFINFNEIINLEEELFSRPPKEHLIKYSIPDFTNIDYITRISGDSMNPLYKSGDLIACNVIGKDKFIQWNRVHVISTKDQGVILRRIRQCKDNDDSYLMISENDAYQSFKLQKKEVLNLSLVVGYIRIE